jgi:hypothetical protein
MQTTTESLPDVPNFQSGIQVFIPQAPGPIQLQNNIYAALCQRLSGRRDSLLVLDLGLPHTITSTIKLTASAITSPLKLTTSASALTRGGLRV